MTDSDRYLISEFEPGKLYLYVGEDWWMSGYAPRSSPLRSDSDLGREVKLFMKNDVVLCVDAPKWKLSGKTLHYTCLVLHKETVMLLNQAYRDDTNVVNVLHKHCGWVALT